ncbi:MAG TPA: hypothetical protein DCR40_11835 [Prolixibacteraceae bacterium]|nr:hypothetical protein [Prolixibacteraceae bacterium]
MKEKDKTREQLLEELKDLRQKHEILNTTYQQDIDDRQRAEEVLREKEKNLQEKVHDLSLLSEITSTFLELASKDDIYNFLGEKIYQLSGSDYLMISEYHEESQSVAVRQSYGITPYIETIAHSIGIDYMQVQVPVSDLKKQMAISLRRKLYRVEGGFYGLTAGKINKIVSASLESLFGIHDILSTGFVWEGNYYGGITFFLKKGNQLNKPDLIQSIIDLASLALSRKYFDQSLIDSEQRYQTLAQVSPVGIFRTDATGSTTYVNPEWSRISGISAAEALGEGWLRAVYPADREKLAVNWKISSQEKKGSSAEYRFIRPDGTISWVLGQAVPEQNSLKETIGYIGTITDITARKKAEKEILKLSRAVEQSPASILITNLEGNLEYANPKALEVTGYQAEEVLGKNPNIFSAGEKPKSEYHLLWDTILSGKEWRGEFHNKKKSGELYWEQASISPIINEKGEITHFLAVKEDITDRKKIENELKDALEKAQESDNLKSAFLANMSHEVRTPLNSIIGFSELLADSKFEQEQKDEFIRHIISNGNNLLAIISDIMDISKLESGEIKIHIIEIPVERFISNLLDQFTFLIKEKSLDFKVFFSENDGETIIFADADRLNQIFNNLINNAIKFTSAGGIEIGYQPKGNLVEFYVKDTGIGIPVEYQEKIFERFRQVESSTTRKFGGNGLGLAITRNLVELMGGKIWLESELGKGTVFRFTLPGKTGIN